MSELVGLSLDHSGSPYLSFEDDPGGVSTLDEQRNGWGVAWYPNGELGAAVVREPRSGRSGEVTDLLAECGMLETPLLVSHVRGAAKRANYRDTHPFVMSFAGRSWVLAHNGDLVGDLSRALPLPDDPMLQPIGSTDTEHLFVWLLGRIAGAGAVTIEDFGFAALIDLLREVNELGTLNMVMSDGSSLLAYRCASGFQPLSHGRFTPPHPQPAPDLTAGPPWPEGAEPVLDLRSAGVTMGLGGPKDGTKSMVVMSTLAFDNSFQALQPGEYVVAKGGRVVAATTAEVPTGDVGTAAGAGPPTGQLVVPSPRVLAPRSERRRLDVEHTTTYRYSTPVQRSSHRFRLKPVHDPFQQVIDSSVDISADGVRYDFEDVFGNQVTGFEVDVPYTELRISMKAALKVITPVDRPHLLPRTQRLPLSWMPWQEHMMHSYLLPPELPESQLVELFDYALSFSGRNKNELVATLDDIAWTIYSDYRYQPGFTTLETTPYEVFRSRAGVCQDFANLMICLARMLNVPARYRVGYIFTGADYDNTLQSDASHAWVEVYVPLMGWRGYDPTNGSRVGADHVRVAAGRNYRDATPTSGVIVQGGGGESLAIDVQVVDRS